MPRSCPSSFPSPLPRASPLVSHALRRPSPTGGPGPEDATSADGDQPCESDGSEDGGEAPSKPAFTLFVDGIPEFVSYYHIRGLFGQIGKLVSVFVQKQRRLGRAFRFGFARYSSLETASLAISLFNGVAMGGSILTVGLARFPRAESPGLRGGAGCSPPSTIPDGDAPLSVPLIGVGIARCSVPFSDDELLMLAGTSQTSPCRSCPPSLLFPEIVVAGLSIGATPLVASTAILSPGLGIVPSGFSSSVAGSREGLLCLSPVVSSIGLGEGRVVAEEDAGAVRRRRGRPKKGEVTGKKKGVVGTSNEEVADLSVVEASPDKGSSLILPEARGHVGAMTRARRDFLLGKQIGVVPLGTDEDFIQDYADHLFANHPRLYGVP